MGFPSLPDELARYRLPENGAQAKRAALALIEYLKQDPEANPTTAEDMTMEDWPRLFLDVKTSPRATSLVVESRPYSPKTLYNYGSIYVSHLRGDKLMAKKMGEITADDLMELFKRIAAHKISLKKNDPKGPYRIMEGTRTYETVYSFVRMTFKAYKKKNPRWYDPFEELTRPKPVKMPPRKGLEEHEALKLFTTNGVFIDEPELERAVCAAMFWAGLRRSEIFGLLPEDLAGLRRKSTSDMHGRDYLIQKTGPWGVQRVIRLVRRPFRTFYSRL